MDRKLQVKAKLTANTTPKRPSKVKLQQSVSNMKLVTLELGVPQQSIVQLAEREKGASSGSAPHATIVILKIGVP